MDRLYKYNNIISDYEESCKIFIQSLDSPDLLDELISARSRFNRSAHYQALFLREEILPALIDSNLPEAVILTSKITIRLADFDNVYNNHLGRWTLQEILADWDSYRKTTLALICACREYAPAEQEKIDIFLRKIAKN